MISEKDFYESCQSQRLIVSTKKEEVGIYFLNGLNWTAVINLKFDFKSLRHKYQKLVHNQNNRQTSTQAKQTFGKHA